MRKNQNFTKISALFIRASLLCTLIMLINVSLQAQTVKIEEQDDLIMHTVSVQLNSTDEAFVISKIRFKELSLIEDKNSGHLFFVADIEKGFYLLDEGIIHKIGYQEMVDRLTYHASLLSPSINNMLAVADGNSVEYFIDFNKHMDQINDFFSVDLPKKNFAIEISDK